MEKEKLKRSIGKLGFSLLAINGLIGAGIFVLPAAAAEAGGFFSPWMFLICGLLMATVVLSFSMLSSYFSGTGGPIVYAYEAFGPAVAFQTGWLLYLGRVTALAANANALALYLTFLWPSLSEGWWEQGIIVATIGILTVSNIYGVKRAMNFVSLITFLKVMPLLIFILWGLTHLEVENLFSTQDFSTEAVGTSMILLVYAFIGFEGAVIPAGEAKNPTRDIPKALIQTLIFTTLLYMLIQAVSVSVVDNISNSKAPLSEASTVLFGSAGFLIMTAVASISIFGNLSSIFVAAPRMTYALANEKSLPEWFSKVDSKYQVPINSIYFMAGFALVLAISGSFVWLAIISSLARMIGYAICLSSLVVIRKKFDQAKDIYRLPFGLLIPAIAFVICIWLAFQASWQSWALTLGFIILGAILYHLNKRRAL